MFARFAITITLLVFISTILALTIYQRNSWVMVEPVGDPTQAGKTPTQALFLSPVSMPPSSPILVEDYDYGLCSCDKSNPELAFRPSSFGSFSNPQEKFNTSSQILFLQKHVADLAVVTFSYGTRYERIANITACSKMVYTKKFNYTFYDIRNELNITVHDQGNVHQVVWNKIAVLQYLLGKHEWLMWMDTDALFLDFRKSMDHLIAYCNGPSNKCDLVIAEDENGINAGVMVFRSSKWSHGVFKEVMKEKDKTRHVFQEQYVLGRTIGTPSSRPYWKSVPQNAMNSNREYKDGEFILHVAGNYMSNGNRKDMIHVENNILNRMKTAFKRDQINAVDMYRQGDTQTLNFFKDASVPMWLDKNYTVWDLIPPNLTIPQFFATLTPSD